MDVSPTNSAGVLAVIALPMGTVTLRETRRGVWSVETRSRVRPHGPYSRKESNEYLSPTASITAFGRMCAQVETWHWWHSQKEGA